MISPNSKPSKGPKGYIPALDGLRALSITLVIAGHAIPQGDHSFIFRAAFLHANLGVRIFFVISGFIITDLLLKERAASNTISIKHFYLRRALRILPAFLLFTGFVAALCAVGVISLPPGYWFFVATFTVNIATSGSWALGHLWSLSVEEQFYLMWPILVKFATRRSCNIIAVAAVFITIPTHFLVKKLGVSMSSIAFPYVCGPIAMGAIISLNAAKLSGWFALSNPLNRRFLFVGSIIAIPLMDCFPGHLGLQSVLVKIATDFLVSACLAMLVFTPEDPVSRALGATPLTVIGKLSYSLYLWQQLFLCPDSRVVPLPLGFPMNILAPIVLAAISYWGLEQRFTGLRQKFRQETPNTGAVVS